MTLIKICGIKDDGIAKAALASGADYLGFVFAEGRRRVMPDQVKSILASLPAGINAVGVFLNQSPQEVEEIVSQSGITHIQLHGEENPEDYRFMGLPIIKAIPVTPAGVILETRLDGSHYGLLDTRLPGRTGGTGTPFNWSAARRHMPPIPIFLAGGLTPANVREAVNTLAPFAVDVSSGVEIDGVKSPELIHQFIKQIRR